MCGDVTSGVYSRLSSSDVVSANNPASVYPSGTRFPAGALGWSDSVGCTGSVAIPATMAVLSRVPGTYCSSAVTDVEHSLSTSHTAATVLVA